MADAFRARVDSRRFRLIPRASPCIVLGYVCFSDVFRLGRFLWPIRRSTFSIPITLGRAAAQRAHRIPAQVAHAQSPHSNAVPFHPPATARLALGFLQLITSFRSLT